MKMNYNQSLGKYGSQWNRYDQKMDFNTIFRAIYMFLFQMTAQYLNYWSVRLQDYRYKIIYLITFIIIFSIPVVSISNIQENTDLRLWYDKPAKSWMTEALPVGNGYMGAMFFGGIKKEQIQFTEGSLWAGGPGAHEDYNYGNREGAWEYMEQVRNFLEDKDFTNAHALATKELTGITHKVKDGPSFGDYGAQVTMGDLYIELLDVKGDVQDYKRELDISNSIGKVTFSYGDIRFKRVYFASYPDRILVYRMQSDKPVSYSIYYVSPHNRLNETFSNQIYSYEGALKDNGQEYETRIKYETDGSVEFYDGIVTVRNASYVNLYHTAATEYLMKFPDYTGKDFRSANDATLKLIEGNTYEDLLRNHQKDYHRLFNRVNLILGSNNYNHLPTDQRLIAYNAGQNDLYLEQLYFQYSRYMMISSSRKGAMPMNLQGKWNHSVDPPWACDYHMNINQQMLYWPAEITNLSECHLPLFDYLRSLVEPGQITAKEHFNTRGWVVNTMNNAYGFTAPGWAFPWGYFPGGAAWLCQHLWEHYQFTQDKDFLKNTAYPIMKEAALFWIDYLIEDEEGYLVSEPSYSPEHGGISAGATMDHQMAWDLLTNCIMASEILGEDEQFIIEAQRVRDNILPLKIGKWGQLQEWKEDVDNPDNKHRHVSHLFALHPGNQITVESTPDFAAAAAVSLNARGDEGTGWSLAWKVNFWARLKDGERAYKLFQRLLKSTENEGTEMVKGGGTYPNLFCAHPPFQLDGNMGACAGIAEMLIQSHAGLIELLPALPSAWQNGILNGIAARGGYNVDMEWKEGQLVSVQITGPPSADFKLKYKDVLKSYQMDSNGNIQLNINDLN
jgi:alpha-L-fucosidase 2